MIIPIQIATTPAQAGKLVAAGVSPETSDMHYRNYGMLLVMGNYHPAPLDSITPAWSLPALWNILHRLDKTYELDTSMDSAEIIELLVTIICNRFNPKPIEYED